MMFTRQGQCFTLQTKKIILRSVSNFVTWCPLRETSNRSNLGKNIDSPHKRKPASIEILESVTLTKSNGRYDIWSRGLCNFFTTELIISVHDVLQYKIGILMEQGKFSLLHIETFIRKVKCCTIFSWWKEHCSPKMSRSYRVMWQIQLIPKTCKL